METRKRPLYTKRTMSADNMVMGKHINFKDNLFIINVRIRMLRDLLHLDPDPDIFLKKTLEDLEFIDGAMESLSAYLIGNTSLLDRETEFDNLSDIEWQFSQLLTEFAGDGRPFSAGTFPETREIIPSLGARSEARRRLIETSTDLALQTRAEPLVSSLELSELLKGL